ncbi:MAG: T9SS type A sorting domain-containing protein [Bacteroidota bacterium]
MKQRFSFSLCFLLCLLLARPLSANFCVVDAENVGKKAQQIHLTYKEDKRGVIGPAIIEGFLMQYLPEVEGTFCPLAPVLSNDLVDQTVSFQFDQRSTQVKDFRAAYLDLLSGQAGPGIFQTTNGQLDIPLPRDYSLVLIALYNTCVDNSQSLLNIIIVDRDLFLCELPEPVFASSPRMLSSALPRASIDLFPNPARDRVSLRYQLTERAKVGLSVVNALGQRVSLFARREEWQEPGEYSQTWAWHSLPSGLYFLQLDVGGHREVLPFAVP